MQALMALFDSELRDEMFLLMELSKIKHYTHFVGLHGSSNEGKKEGSITWPGTNEILMLLLTPEQVESFKKVVKEYKEERTPKPGLLLFSWPLTEML